MRDIWIKILRKNQKLQLEKRSWKKEMKHMIAALEGVGMDEFVRYMKSPWRIIWANFLAGIFRGLGIIVGMTVVFAILIAILNQMVDWPLIGEYFGMVKNMLEQFSNGQEFGR
jgi:hypothetical protein